MTTTRRRKTTTLTLFISPSVVQATTSHLITLFLLFATALAPVLIMTMMILVMPSPATAAAIPPTPNINSTTTTTTTTTTHPPLLLHPRGPRRFLFYCRGRANGAADGYGCGGPCSIYYEGDPLDDYSIVCPGTNCVDTDGSWKFMVCDVAYDCSISKNFRPGIDTQGRYIWNTPGTSYIYPGVN